MQRLILAAIVAYLLLPEEFAPQLSADRQDTTPVSTVDAVGAAQDVLNDLSNFCERNTDACQTGQAIVSGARQKVLEGLESPSGEQPSALKN